MMVAQIPEHTRKAAPYAAIFILSVAAPWTG